MYAGMFLGEWAVNCFGGLSLLITVFFIKKLQILELPQVSLSRTSSGEEKTNQPASLFTVPVGFYLYRV